MLDLPGFRALEDKLLLYSSPGAVLEPELERAADELSKRTFGILANEIDFDTPEKYWGLNESDPERLQIDDLFEEYERQFDDVMGSDESAAAALKSMGLDFTDDRGFPLRCVSLFARQAMAAAKGIKGKLPDATSAALERWGSRLQQDADLFRVKRKGR